MLTIPSPLVSCICPITKSREKYLPILFRSFLNQTHDRKELIFVSEDDIDFPAHPAVRLIRCESGLTVGAKRNIGAASAKGEVIAHFDSDDFSKPGRITEQLMVIRQIEKPVVGYTSVLFYNEARHEAYRLRPGPSDWAAGTSLMYTKAYWQANNFDDRSVGEDTLFCKVAAGQSAIFSIDSGNIIALDHDTNTSPRSGDGLTHEYSEWFYRPVADVDAVREMILPKPKRIALAIMTWNTSDISLENVEALKAEAKRLGVMGYNTEIIVCDNGSTDGLPAELKKQKGELAWHGAGSMSS